MEQQVKPFENFLPGNHLILGEAGSGKTRLIWSILQSKEFFDDDSINIVLTDSEKRIWYNPSINPIMTIDPFETDIAWISQPSKPGIYYCACDYAPRINTFLECLATWAIQNQENMSYKVRIFIDFPSKFWTLPEFVEQLSRLYYISNSLENGQLEIWSVLCPLKKLSPKTMSIFDNTHLVLINPFPQKWGKDMSEALNLKSNNSKELVSSLKTEEGGFYYLPDQENTVYLNPNPIQKF